MKFFQKKQTVLLTGAARGIGSSTAQFLARAGFDLILLDLKKGPWQKQALNLGLEHKVKVQTFVLEIKQSVTDYMNGWRYEQGLTYQQGETFEHYLRRVIRHILDLQKGQR